jgi:valyl-tRNA synthetase
MTKEAGALVAGMTVVHARQTIVQELRRLEMLEKEEDYQHSISLCSRSKNVIEPLLSLQWFIKTKPLAEKALEAVKSGKVKIVPERYEKVYYHWLENIRDWNISRQIWWGHRLPVWYSVKNGKEQVKVSITSPGEEWHQDTDTLDTWFSSGLWTFSTLGWPKKTKDFKRFHPTNVMETGWDILFFWVARMMMFSLYFVNDIPFETIYLHGLVLDRDGKKMSKSKGTGIDPLPMAEKYGMDAVRMSLIIGNAPGQDFRLYEEKIEGYRNFANKLWNIGRYIATQAPTSTPELSDGDHWILSRLQAVTEKVTRNIEQYQLSLAGQSLYEFLWHDVADWYIEYSKIQPNPAVLKHVWNTALRLHHPFMPFITEALWVGLQEEQLLLVSDWPTLLLSPYTIDTEAAQRFQKTQDTVAALRVFRVSSGLTAQDVGEVVADANAVRTMTTLSRTPLRSVERLTVGANCIDIQLGHHVFHFPKHVVAAYAAWQKKERESLQHYIEGIEKKLSNQSFVERAPADVVAEEQKKLAEAKDRLLHISEN